MAGISFRRCTDGDSIFRSVVSDVTTNPHVLDNPVWHALSTAHASFAEGDDFAKRYPPAAGPLAGLREPSVDSYSSLARLLYTDDVAALVFAAPLAPPATWEILRAMEIGQMVCTTDVANATEYPVERLAPSRIPEMLSLTELTKPGPFGPRTAELGTYLGIEESGRLVAMAGIRLRLPGYSEISAVCTHPDFRGRGYARSLVSALMLEIRGRAETPFLHVRMDNTGAVRVYEKLGFAMRQSMHLCILKRA